MSSNQRHTAAGQPRSVRRAVIAGLLGSLLVSNIPGGTPLLAERTSTSSAHPRSAKLQRQERTFHALNRFTFGPHPGEAEEVDRIGLKRWFETQLHPETIDDSALNARLAAFPAMALPQAELMERYPSPQRLRAMMERNDPLPTDPIEHAIYADGMAVYKQAETRKAAAETVPAPSPQPPVTSTPDGTTPPLAGPAESVSQTNPSAQKNARSVARVNLLAADASMYTMPGKKKSGTMPAVDTQPQTMAQGDLTPAARNRGKAQHDELAFPETTTREILALAPDARVRRILALEPAQLADFRRSLSQAELVDVARDLTPQQKEIFAALAGSERMIGAELLESRLERDVYSRRELEAVMTDFWLNHFNVYLRKNGNEPYLPPAYERETIRPHALGRFEDLLVATAQSPAMLMYLDNWESIGPDSDAAHRGARLAEVRGVAAHVGPAQIGPARLPAPKQPLNGRGLNENYARELLELHTLGVSCEASRDRTASQIDRACVMGYTQADVTEVARVFTGWTIDRPAEGAQYRFEPRRHQPGSKNVLGRGIPDNGEAEGLEVLHMLAMSPATARLLSTELAIRFVSDTPPPRLVDRMSKSYLSSGGDIRSVLRTLFNSPEFWSPSVYRAKVKTPLEFVASALRAADAEVTDAVPVVQALDRLGMPLYGMPTPNGYSASNQAWVSTGALVSRLNFALLLSSGRLPGTRTSLLDAKDQGAQPVASRNTASAGVNADAATAEQQQMREQQLEKLLLGTEVSPRTREAVLAQAQSLAPASTGHSSLGTSSGSSAAAEARSPSQPSAAAAQTSTMAGLLLGSPEFQRR